MAKDFYSTLGISRSASASEIKSAYRKLSKELHPDKHKGDKDKEAKFKEVNEAYEVLSNPEKKKRYDQFGSADGPQFGRGAGGGFENFDFSQFTGGGGFGDIFENFFGGARGGRRGQPDLRGSDVQLSLSIPFGDAVSGVEREISFETQIVCDVCSGSGAEKGSNLKTCETCSGTGQVMRTTNTFFGMMQQASVCPTCKGSGKVPEKACKSCGGDGRKKGRKTVTIKIPAGISSGQSIRIRGEGQAGKQGGPAGDLFVVIDVIEDSRFDREGDDIRSTAHIDLTVAVLGDHISIETVHGPVKLTIPAGTQSHQIFRIKGKGMPVLNTHRHGDHYVTVIVDIPEKLSKEQKRLFEELRESY
jgi:molecular chaperone DnaJ